MRFIREIKRVKQNNNFRVITILPQAFLTTKQFSNLQTFTRAAPTLQSSQTFYKKLHHLIKLQIKLYKHCILQKYTYILMYT